MWDMDDLYQEMKAALKFFGVPFGQMQKVMFCVTPEGKIAFIYEDRRIEFSVPVEGIDVEAP